MENQIFNTIDTLQTQLIRVSLNFKNLWLDTYLYDISFYLNCFLSFFINFFSSFFYDSGVGCSMTSNFLATIIS